jgi:hypothetical protein
METIYSHNLKIIIVDNNDVPLDNTNNILEKVYSEFANIIYKKNICTEIGNIDFFVFWERKYLKDDIEKIFIGDLFTSSFFSDMVLNNGSYQLLNEIQNKLKKENPTIKSDWQIKFYIYKLMDIPNIYDKYKENKVIQLPSDP